MHALVTTHQPVSTSRGAPDADGPAHFLHCLFLESSSSDTTSRQDDMIRDVVYKCMWGCGITKVERNYYNQELT